MSYRVGWISEWKEAEGLALEWEALVERSHRPNIFLTPLWLRHWCNVYGQGLELTLLTVRDEGGDLVGLAPLAESLERGLGLSTFRRLILLGSFGVAGDHLDFILEKGREEKIAEAILSTLFEAAWDELLLSDLPQDSPTPRLLLRVGNPWGCEVTQRTSAVCPHASLPSSWDDYLATLSRNHREQWRARDRRLREQCGATVRAVEKPEDLGPALDRLMALHERRWAGRGALGRGAFSFPEFRAFHRKVSQCFLQRRWLNLIWLEANGRPIAMQYNFDYLGTTYYYVPALDPDWQKFSPGLVLMGHAIARSIQRGQSEFDFLRGEEPYKAKWANGARRTMTLQVRRQSVRSSLRDHQQRVKQLAIRGAGRLLPEPLKQRLRWYRRRATRTWQ